jgi:hypothetical protein
MTTEELMNLMAVSSAYGISAAEAGEALKCLSMVLENGRKKESSVCLDKFRVKSEEVEFDWIS